MNLYSTALLLTIFFSAEAIPPNINVTDPYVFDTTKEGHLRLSLRCWGDKNVTWQEPTFPHDHGVDPFTIKYERSFTGQYISILTIPVVYTSDTSEYTCRNEDGEFNSTYVYIFDGTSPFANNNLRITKWVRMGEPFFVDCRTTHPDIKVTLYRNDVEVPPGTFINDRYMYSKNATSLRDAGLYSCKETRFSTTQEWVVQVIPSRVVFKPSISKSRNTHYVKGVSFVLKCSIVFKNSHRTQLNWIKPNPNTVSSEKTLIVGNLLENTLTVPDPTEKDSGVYQCGESDFLSTDNITVTIREKITPFVKFISKYSRFKILHRTTLDEGQNASFIIDFEGYPDDIRYEIMSPTGRLVRHNPPKTSISFDYLSGIITVRLMEARPENFGVYRVSLFAPNNASDRGIAVLRVNSPPKVRMNGDFHSFSLYENVSLSASILAYSMGDGEPEVAWTLFNQCRHYAGHCDRENGIILHHSFGYDYNSNSSAILSPRAMNITNRYATSVNFETWRSGLVQLQVKNNLGINTTEKYFVIKEDEYVFFMNIRSSDGIDIKTPPHELNDRPPLFVVEKDEISVECFGLAFVFENLTMQSPGSVFNCSSQFSHGRCSHFVAVEGSKMEIRCLGFDYRTGQRESIVYHVIVLEEVPLIIRNTSNLAAKESDLFLEPGEEFSLKCHVDGRPKPSVTWLKDDVDIDELEEFHDEDRVSVHPDKSQIDFKFASQDFQGRYTCRVQNRNGLMEFYTNIYVQGESSTAPVWAVIGVSVALLGAFSAAVLILTTRVRRESRLRKELRRNQLYLFEKGNVGDLNTECTIDEQADLLPYDLDYEIHKDRIKLGKILGAGAFGRVMLAEVEDLEGAGKCGLAAVKMCKDGADMAHLRALTLELKIMVHLGKHLNIVNLIGAHTTKMDKGDLWILVEYCKYGNILKFMQRHKKRFVNQIDPLTGYFDITKWTPIGSEPNSPTSFCTSERQTSSQSARPGLYVDNPHYAATEYCRSVPLVAVDSPRVMEPYIMAAELPPAHPRQRVPSQSTRSSEGTYHITPHTEMTALSTPVPFSPCSTISGEFIFDTSGNPVPLDGLEGVPVPGISGPFTTSDLICWSWQVANGMEYLSKRKVLHGDLAARNLLLAQNNVVKISDFGLSRDMYKTDVYMKKGDDIMPIKWMAPEAIQQKVFSTQSDVWAFGVTMWELFSLGNTPYPGVPLNQEFTLALESGMRMKMPRYSDEKLYSIMMNCWKSNPVERPSFGELVHQLAEFLCPDQQEAYVNMNDVYVQRNKKWMEFKEDYLTMVSSPDFENLNKSRPDLTYIEMQSMASPVSGCDPNTGYLDMRSMRNNAFKDSIFSPRPTSLPDQISPSHTMFPFDENVPQKQDLVPKSPVETSNLLPTSSESEETSSKDSILSENPNNNNTSKMTDYNEADEIHYQNVANLNGIVKDSGLPNTKVILNAKYGDSSEDHVRNYVNL